MKTLLVTALLAVAIGACSSDTSSSLVTPSGGNAQGTACTSTTDCDTNLVCAFAITGADAGTGATSCGSAGVCVGVGPLSVLQACSCASPSTPISVEQLGGIYTTTPASLCEPGESSDAAAGGSTTGG
jgi:hypothetical protein